MGGQLWVMGARAVCFSEARVGAASSWASGARRLTPDEVVQHLRAEDVAIVTGPGRRQGALGTLISVYCRDPDGSLIEIASYT